MADYGDLNRVRRAHTAAHGEEATLKILERFGGVDENGDLALTQVVEENFDDAIAALSTGAARKLRTISDIDHVAVWAKWNGVGRV